MNEKANEFDKKTFLEQKKEQDETLIVQKLSEVKQLDD